MIQELPYVFLLFGIGLGGLWMSNIMYDYKVPQYVSRKVGHATGGVLLILFPLLFHSALWPIIIFGLFTIMLAGARLLKPDGFRGVGGTGRAGAMSEVWFPLSALPVMGVGWLWLGHPALAIAPLLMMAWGDCVTGLIRSKVYGRAVKGRWGSVGMLGVSLIIAWALVTPFWVGVVGAGVATVAEWACGDVGVFKRLDDNYMIPLTAAAVILGLWCIL